MRQTSYLIAFFLLSALATSVEAINPGHSGAWIDSNHSAQGVVFEVVATDHVLTAYWFTWTDKGDLLWLVGQGTYDGNRADLIVYRAQGGRFLMNDPTTLDLHGTATVSTLGCQAATLTYQAPDGSSHTLDLSRLAPASGCQSNVDAGVAEFAVDSSGDLVGLDGSWLYEGCVSIDSTRSLSRETITFVGDRMDIAMTLHGSPDCSGAAQMGQVSLLLRAAGRGHAELDGQNVPVTRFDMTDIETGEAIQQVLYVESAPTGQRLTHGVFSDDGGRTDAQGFPLDLHPVFLIEQP